jgi:LPXTG-site transpeptidase (sortase) family protein
MNANRVSWIGALPHGRFLRGFIISLGVLAFSLLLLIPWFTSIAAPAVESNLEVPEGLVDHPEDDSPLPDSYSIDNLRGMAAQKSMAPLAPLLAPDYDYGVTKYANPPTFTIGTNNEYVINVSGVVTVGTPSPAIYDLLPTGMRWTSITANNWSCGSETTIVNCTYALTVPVGNVNFPPIRVTVDVPVNIEPVVTNTVSINPPDPHPGNDTFSVPTAIDSVDLAIEKKVSQQAVNEGDTIAYTIVITNYGPADAKNVKVVDIISTEGISITGGIVPPGTTLTIDSNTKFTWNVGPLPKGAGSRTTLVVNALTQAASNGKQVINTATVSSSNASDWKSSNNTATASFIVGGLTISKSVRANSTPVYTGEPITFTILITNTSDTKNATSVRIRDVLDDDLEIMSTNPQGCKPSTNTINCSFGTITTLQPTRFLVVRTRAKTTLTGVETITNTATVSWTPSGSSSTLSRTSEEAKIDVYQGGTLDIDKTDRLSYVSPGQAISYTITITNVGSLAVNSLLVTDTFDSDMEFVSINPGSLTIIEKTSPSGTRAWRITNPSSLSPGSKITFSINARVSSNAPEYSYIENTITVSGKDTTDRIAIASDYDSDQTIGGLEITKSVSLSTALVGQPLTYIITVRNTSSSLITSINVQDTFASTLDILSPLPQGSSYNSSTRTFSYYLSQLASQSNFQLTIPARANNTVATNRTIYNKATVTWGSPAQSGTSNQVSTEVSPAGALLVEKSLYSSQSLVYPGDTISYTIAVTNIGSLNISSIFLNDILDPYLDYQAIYPGSLNMSGNCSDSTHFCSWAINSPSTLAPNGKISFSIMGKVLSSTPLGYVLENIVNASATDSYSHAVSGSDTLTKTITTAPDAPDMSITLDLDPQQVRVGDSMTVKIGVRNKGDVDASEVYAGIKFPTLLDITSASTTRGTATTNSSDRSVVVNIGTLAAGHSTHITIVVKVNSTAVVNKAHSQEASLIWYKDNEIDSNMVRFRVMPGSTLPGTGILLGDPRSREIFEQIPGINKKSSSARLPDFTRSNGIVKAESEKSNSPVSLILGAVCSILGLIGLVLVIYGLWARIRRPLWAGWYSRIGLILMLSGFLFGLAGLGFNRRASPTPTQQLAELAGTKPIYPTREPTQIPPTPEAIATFWLPPTTTPTPLALPEYPIPTPTAIPAEGPNGGEPDASDVTRIKIPAMGLDTVVKFVPFDGDTWLIGGLKQEIAWMGDTSWPGLGGNTGLAGHIDLADGSKGPFWNLKDLESGDEVLLYTQQKIYVYKVRNQVVVEDSDLSVIDPSEDPQITLITCTGWDPELRIYLQRLIVFATLSDVKTLQGS